MAQRLTNQQEAALKTLLAELINQEAAQILVPPYRSASGFWFGGGNLAQDDDGDIWLSGRYRNYGDSRAGLAAGERGLECCLFRSAGGGHSFGKVCSWTKADLSRPDRKVLSIEGTGCSRYVDCLVTPDGILAAWQQSQADESQPLVGHFLPQERVEHILGGGD